MSIDISKADLEIPSPETGVPESVGAELATISLAISAKRIANYLSEIRTTMAEHKDIREAVAGLEERVGKQTSPKVSALAAKYLGADTEEIMKWGGFYPLIDDLKTLAASCLAQDERKGS